jgi:PadR family transcriptional regulator PadR
VSAKISLIYGYEIIGRRYDLISSDIIRGYNDIIILYLLVEDSSYGYEISKRIREISNGEYIIKETTLYSAFARLEKNGFIESYFGEETQGKRRTYFKITQAGIDYYKEKCEEWVVTKDVVNKFIREME